VYRDDHDGLRERLVGYCNRLLDDGLAIGSAGDMSVRAGGEVLITPSGAPAGVLARGAADPAEAELAEVTAEIRRRRYGEARQRSDGP
jgi:Class II Aldolase and Adducin N-terminal domain